LLVARFLCALRFLEEPFFFLATTAFTHDGNGDSQSGDDEGEHAQRGINREVVLRQTRNCCHGVAIVLVVIVACCMFCFRALCSCGYHFFVVVMLMALHRGVSGSHGFANSVCFLGF